MDPGHRQVTQHGNAVNRENIIAAPAMVIAAPAIDRVALGHSFVAWARTQVGVRWEHQGRVPRAIGAKNGGGVDCVGLPVCTVRAHGLPIKDMRSYSQAPTPAQLLACVQSNCAQVSNAVAGCLVLFWLRRASLPCHVGISNGEGGVIHCHRLMGGGCVEEVDMAEVWGGRVHSCWGYDLACASDNG